MNNRSILQIIENNKKREEITLSSFATFSDTAQRRRQEQIPDEKNIRPAFFHDTDRIIHCKSYSRYIDKTQVFFRAKNDHVTRRVLHVQLVSKIARTLGRFFQANEDLIEAIALAHDIGHAPFGHAGEDFIAQKLEEHNEGSFVHNAQSVRILDKLEKGGKGLNLTLQVLDGVLGHNGEICNQKIPFYKENLSFEILDENVNKCFTLPRAEKPDTHINPSTLEGAIVRISDIIAYIGRDLDDAEVLNLIRRDSIPKSITSVLGTDTRSIISKLLLDLVANTDIQNSELSFSMEVFEALNELKAFNYKNIYLTPQINEQKSRYRKIVKELYEEYVIDFEKENFNSDLYTMFLDKMPEMYKEETSVYRIVADYIAGMTDRFLVQKYHEHFLPFDFDILQPEKDL